MARKTSMRLLNAIAAFGILIAAPIQADAATVIDYGPEPNSFWWNRFEPTMTTFGQTFSVPNSMDTVISEFSFWVRSDPDYPFPFRFRPFLAEWGTLGIAGAPLFVGAVRSNFYSELTEIKVETGGIALDPTKQYVVYLSSYDLYDGLNEAVFISGHFGAIEYPGGFTVYDQGLGAAPGAVWTNPCNIGAGLQANCADAAFRVVLNEPSSAPEPGTLALLGLGLAGLAATRGRRH